MNPFGHTDFERAFSPGATFDCPERGTMRVSQVEAGTLFLPSGRIVACDPSNLGWTEDREPFSHAVLPGHYPVLLSVVAHLRPNVSTDRIACALIPLKATSAIAWELALRPGQDPQDLRLGDYFGYGVDAGIGCFVDAQSVEHMDHDEGWQLYRGLLPLLDAAEAEGRKWATLSIDADNHTNLIAFSSGYGDGVYPSYWGIDRTGQRCCLVTDFHVLVEVIVRRASFQIASWQEKDLEHADFAVVGLQVRNVPQGPDGRQVQLEVHSGECDARVINQGKEYTSRSVKVINGILTFDFRLDEPLQSDAVIEIEYTMGVQGL